METQNFTDLTELVDALSTLANPFVDGIQIGDVGPITSGLVKVWPAVQGIENIDDALEGITNEQKAQVESIVQRNLTNVSGEKWEYLRETVVDWVLTTAKLFIRVRKAA